MSVKDTSAQAKQRMEKAIADLQHAMATVRTGRASVSVLDGITVDFYGTPTPLNGVATLHVPEPAMITAQPWDSTLIGAIEKAIRAAGLGLNPANDGKLIRIPIPPLNEERRRELAKQVSVMAEDHRVSVRNIRRDCNESLKKLLKDKAISEDDERRGLDEIQKTTDAAMKRVDELAKAKEKEILELK